MSSSSGRTAQVQILKRMSKDPDFRVHFFKDPIRAVADAHIVISVDDLAPIAKVTPRQFDTVVRVGKSVADNGEDLAYLVFCVVAFLLTIEPAEGLAQQVEQAELLAQEVMREQ